MVPSTIMSDPPWSGAWSKLCWRERRSTIASSSDMDRFGARNGTSMVKRHIIPSHTTELSMLVYSFYIYIYNDSEHADFIIITIYHNISQCLFAHATGRRSNWNPVSDKAFRWLCSNLDCHFEVERSPSKPSPCGKTNNKPTVWEWSVPPMVIFGIFLHWHLHKKQHVYCI